MDRPKCEKLIDHRRPVSCNRNPVWAVDWGYITLVQPPFIREIFLFSGNPVTRTTEHLLVVGTVVAWWESGPCART
eukprot:COSAG02_NODE_3009_length_7559_cov_14.154424_3_plen_76_part_00